MPDLDGWNPTAAANMFVTEKLRRKRDTTTSTESKYRVQPYFKGVFPEARKLADADAEQPVGIGPTSNKFFDF